MLILCLLHDIVLTEYLTHFNYFKCFSTPGEVGFEDVASEDVVQDVDIGDEA